jgi:hypothetical protein
MDRPNDAVWLLDPEQATNEDFERALVHWDELDAASLRALSGHPIHGRRLDAVQLAETWLEDHLEEHAPPAVAACPSAGELYDYARGPGAAPLFAERRAQIDRHLIRCRPCEGLALELKSRPPVPLADLPAAPLDELDRALLQRICPQVPVISIEKRPSILRWAPLAAAASLVAFAVLGRDGGDTTQLPIAEPVRGTQAWALTSPAGPLLWVPAAAANEWFDVGCAPRFELVPMEGATEYFVEVYRHGGGALDAGERIADLANVEPVFAAFQLDPGRYTWRAHATVRGLDVDLGARDFQVVENVDLIERTDGLRRAEAIVMLHESGFESDARRLAEGLPQSPERDAYLGRDLPR